MLYHILHLREASGEILKKNVYLLETVHPANRTKVNSLKELTKSFPPLKLIKFQSIKNWINIKLQKIEVPD